MIDYRIIIAGGRDFNDYEHLKLVMDSVHPKLREDGRKLIVVSGKARGADALGERWAIENNIPVEEFPADWATHGKSAGYKRNEQMAIHSDGLVAFWDGKSRGTEHMINLAKKHGLKAMTIRY